MSDLVPIRAAMNTLEFWVLTALQAVLSTLLFAGQEVLYCAKACLPLVTGRPVGLALYGRSNRESVESPEAVPLRSRLTRALSSIFERL
eukprot:2006712-Pleurochrysis_carterae.AAC.1